MNKPRPVALITGVTGQDGALLSKLLLDKNYIVHGIKRRSSSFNTERVNSLFEDPKYKGSFFLHYGDVTDATNVIRLIQKTKPTEIYNLAAQSHVKVSFETAEYTANADALGVLRILEAIRILNMEKTTRFYQASTSELFGSSPPPQSEVTPFVPQSPYAAAKLYAYWIVINYRNAYGIYASNGILFNHEGPTRGETFISRKISRQVARIALGKEELITLGNLDARRDWGHAKDFVEGIWMIMQYEKADDFVLATGQCHSVRDFVEAAFLEIGKTISWRGSGLNEEGIDQDGKVRVRVSEVYFRPTEVNSLQGDASKAQRILGWSAKIKFNQLVKEMVQCDLEKQK
jgi:GDPmannose 4,6-dehydratase